MFQTFLRDLQQPEDVHVLINPLPVYGLAVGVIGLIVALFLRNRSAQIVALILILITSASAWPVIEFGEEAFDRVLSMADKDGEAWLKAHEARAEKLEYLFYAVALLSAAALLLPKKWPRYCDALGYRDASSCARLVRRRRLHRIRGREDSSPRVPQQTATSHRGNERASLLATGPIFARTRRNDVSTNLCANPSPGGRG